mmetsp:Transcript_16226/g.37095  ORF Transcript_16226/g.37095 Transcript_16226/m.37095 type:complete len:329 (+) Transcript_16226:67-1053(+)
MLPLPEYRALLLRLRPDLPLQDVPHQYLIPGVIPVALLEGVAARHRYLRPVVVERKRAHARGALGDPTELLLVLAVPGDDGPVGPAGGKGPEDRVEGDGVDGVDGVIDPVALEGVLLLARLDADIVEELDGHPALDAAHGDRPCVGEEPNDPRLVLEARLPVQYHLGRVPAVLLVAHAPGPDVNEDVPPPARGHHGPRPVPRHVHAESLARQVDARRGRVPLPPAQPRVPDVELPVPPRARHEVRVDRAHARRRDLDLPRKEPVGLGDVRRVHPHRARRGRLDVVPPDGAVDGPGVDGAPRRPPGRGTGGQGEEGAGFHGVGGEVLLL